MEKQRSEYYSAVRGSLISIIQWWMLGKDEMKKCFLYTKCLWRSLEVSDIYRIKDRDVRESCERKVIVNGR